MEKKILFSGFRDLNHSSYGGYHNIIDFPGHHKVLLSNNYLFGKIDKKYHLRKIPYWLLDLDTRIRRYKYDITHLFYGEITMFPFLPYVTSSSHKVVATIHLDIKKQRFFKYYLKCLQSLDGIIVLSSQQKEIFENTYGLAASFIPHGFNPPQYSFIIPQDLKGQIIDTQRINLITCGSNYRDFETLREVIKNTNNNIRFHLVGLPSAYKQEFISYSNTLIYPRISNDAYYSLIQMCDFNFLPLTFATANNALLEAQSIGIRSILPNIHGIADYGAPGELNIYYNSIHELMCLLKKIQKSQLNQEIIQFSKQFEWHNIYSKLNLFYDQILGR